MQGTLLVASSLVLLLGSAAASDDVTICDQQRLGDSTDSLMYFPNAWNDKSPDGGFVCMKVDNNTPAFDATWNWVTDIQDVHSFPYVHFWDDQLPIRLSNLTSIRLSTEWIMTPGTASPRSFDKSTWTKNKKELEGGRIQTNAAWDFFLDDDKNKTMYAQAAAVEFMVWLGRVGDPWWLGRKEKTILSNITLGETEFSLYYGRNSGGTHVFTAVSSNDDDILSLDEDFYPLFKYILEQAAKNEAVSGDLPKDPWLGVVEFGSENWFSDGNVTFTAANFGMKLNGGGSGDKNGSSGGKNSNGTSSDDDNAGSMLDASVIGYIVPAVLVVFALLSH